MRRLILKVPAGRGEEVIEKARQLDGKNLTLETEQEGERVTVHLNNKEVSNFIGQISDIEEAEITLIPRGIVTLYPPQDEAPDQVADVSYRSPLEIFLGGIQSVGSKFGLVSYAIAGGIIAWIGLYTNTSFLLVAAMLVAPFAGPAMNSALAAASGKAGLLKQSLIRYFLSIGTAVLVSFLLSLVFGQKFATQMMVSISHVSQVAVLLPLVAGFAGGINLVQSERDSLVSGAAVGMLVAASLAPPAGIIGMAAAFGNWQLVRSGVFLILLQLAGIQLSAALVFRFVGKVTVKGVRFSDGKENVFRFSMLVSVLALAALLYWQFARQPSLQKASLSTQVTESIRSALKPIAYIETIKVTSTFTRGTLPDKNPVLCELNLYNRSDSIPDEVLKQRLVGMLRDSIRSQKINADPMFNITFLK
ncbi:DUF389 domain-containing protein [Botryobacter ruber]|uniref:DUF389 domain-containing protein n=1 Tax=Botryobacter ruber TaxID=2171629 RepID=UPI000E09E407|nr:DUF389 domain-containing protein [Botryobacter ruber]